MAMLNSAFSAAKLASPIEKAQVVDIWKVFRPFIQMDEGEEYVTKAQITLNSMGGTIIATGGKRETNQTVSATQFTGRLSAEDAGIVWRTLCKRFDLPYSAQDVRILLDADAQSPLFYLTLAPDKRKSFQPGTEVVEDAKV